MTNYPRTAQFPREGTDLNLAHVADARRCIDPTFLNTPVYEDDMLCREVGRRVAIKIEALNPIRSFKARGVSFALQTIPRGETVVCASSGNFGQAVAFVGRTQGLRVIVHTAYTVNSSKRARMGEFGAQVVDSWPNMDAARSAAKIAAAETSETHLITDGVEPAIAEGASTIAQELTRIGHLDSVVVPVGDGSLISGIGAWMREYAPDTRVIGVNSKSAPAMHRSYYNETATAVPTNDIFCEGINISRPSSKSLARVRNLVDDFVLVDEEQILDAMAKLFRHVSILPEPAGAAGLAAIASGNVEGERIATILTGSNFNPASLPRFLEYFAAGGDQA